MDEDPKWTVITLQSHLGWATKIGVSRNFLVNRTFFISASDHSTRKRGCVREAYILKGNGEWVGWWVRGAEKKVLVDHT